MLPLLALLPSVLAATILAGDPCNPSAASTFTLTSDLSALLPDPTSYVPSPAPIDLRLTVDTTALLRTAITDHFTGATVLDRKNVVTNNSTGKPILTKKGAKQYKVMAGVTEIRQATDAFLIRSQLQIDADGSADSTAVDPEHGQVNTSLKWRDAEGKLHSFNTHSVPFFVMPYHWYKDHGVQPGDVAAVVYGDRVEYAVFADVGPWQKLGEGSIALHDNLGNNPWTKSGKPWNGIEQDPGVTLVVFPGSRDRVFPVTEGKQKETFVVDGAPDQDRVRRVGQELLEGALGVKVGVTPRTTPTERP